MKEPGTIIGVSGSFASGKSIAALVLAEKKGFKIYSFGKMIEEILIEEGMDVNRRNLQEKGLEIIKEVGYNGIADLLVSRYGINPANPCIIEGIRHIDVAIHYSTIYSSNFKLLFIKCSKETRFNRIRGILYKGVIINTREEFDSFDSHLLETEMAPIMQKSDRVIINEGSKEEFIDNINGLTL